jgi:hypothetical protein
VTREVEHYNLDMVLALQLAKTHADAEQEFDKFRVLDD